MDGESGRTLDEARMAALVAGAHPQSEVHDRPLAYHLQAQIVEWQAAMCDEPPLEPLVLSDVWFLNHDALLHRPMIAIGHPRYNALTAFLTARLPLVAAEEEQYLIQMDISTIGVRACLWGAEPDDTRNAMDRFLDEFFDDWVAGATACVAASA